MYTTACPAISSNPPALRFALLRFLLHNSYRRNRGNRDNVGTDIDSNDVPLELLRIESAWRLIQVDEDILHLGVMLQDDLMGFKMCIRDR